MRHVRPSRVIASGLALGVLVAAGAAAWWAQSDPERWGLAAGAGLGVVVLGLWALLGPGAKWLSGERGGLTADERSTMSAAERVESVNQARQALMQSVTGMVVIIGVVFTAAGLLYTARTLEVTQQGQVTDRYTKAIEQLGSPKPEVRMGGIYALERLMADSDRDRRTILEVLAAYIRTHAQDPPPARAAKVQLAVDVQSALTVVSRATTTGTVLDLRNVDLHGKNLSHVKLARADLSYANLADTNLYRADLAGVNLTYANLSETVLSGANLSGAELLAANLTNGHLDYINLSRARLSFAKLSRAFLLEAILTEAQLYKANLVRADLSSAHLANADLNQADLSYADLDDADLRETQLSGAKFCKAQGLYEEQRKIARLDEAATHC